MILTKIITTPKVQLLVIGGLPEDAVNVKIVKGENRNELFYWHNNATTFVRAIWDSVEDGNWQPVGFLKDLNEDDAEKLVEKITFDKWKHYGNVPDYFELLFDTAKESLLSLIESEVKLKNKYGEHPTDALINMHGRMYETYKKWQAEQSEVFTNPFILIKK